jgi:hypothetical protein
MSLPERLARTALAVKCKIQLGAARQRLPGRRSRDALLRCHSGGGGPVGGMADVVPGFRSRLIAMAMASIVWIP